MSTETVEFIIRDCGPSGFLPIIRVVNDSGKSRELYRGEHCKATSRGAVYGVIAREAAWHRIRRAWDDETTGNIKEFKRS